ncbi:MAG: hypothetical protein NZM35_07065 [Chitinophagales bacterium]|nr:hypothetical protein [Chitinophagales bacterium]
MKFENKREKIVPFRLFLIRMGIYTMVSAGIVVISILAGTIGYHHYAQLTWIDSFHNACMILTGMGPVAVMNSNAAKIFSSVYALYSGVAFLSTTAVFFAPLVHRILHILHVED